MLALNDFRNLFDGGTLAQQSGVSRAQAGEIAERACELLDAGAAADAVNIFQGLVILNHKDAGNWCSLGIACLEAGRVEDAKTALETALELQPDFPTAKKYLARLRA